ncbi:MAG: VCBS repeat-containing protein [Candidatus Zixiibacteriota bacterium]|nr:MAG: VCBS repeat-containing protein [candidate division Zixibacteria bacterium]
MKGIMISLLTAFICLASSIGAAEDIFDPPVAYSSYSWATSVFIADLDGDYDKDVVTAHGSSNFLAINWNLGTGSFSSAVPFGTGYVNNPEDVVAYDFDKDGDNDLAVANYGNNTMTVFFNDGSGEFVDHPAQPQIYNVCGKPRDLAVAWLATGDQYWDMAIGCEEGNGVQILSWNSSIGGFQSKGDVPVGSGSGQTLALCILDYDSDGDADIAATNDASNDISIIENYGDFIFQQSLRFGNTDSPYDIGSPDLDNQNGKDVVVASKWDNQIHVYMKNGQASFNGTPAQYATCTTPLSVVHWDYDDDGDIDVAVAGASGVKVHLNNGSGDLSQTQTYTGPAATSIYAEDLNNDDAFDLVAVGGKGASIHVYINRTEVPFICGDANNDGVISVADVVYIINYIFHGGPPPDPYCSGEVNGDGSVNIGDAVYLVSYIFKGGSEPNCSGCSRAAKQLTDNSLIPTGFKLHDNYPNPFNPRTTIGFTLPAPGDVLLQVYNIAGQKVATVADGFYGAGTHNVIWDATGAASGVYLYRIEAGNNSASKKMLLLK